MQSKANHRRAKPKPKPKRIVQRSLFDKTEPKPKRTWKQPPHRKSEDPNWFWTWQAPAFEDTALRKRTLGW